FFALLSFVLSKATATSALHTRSLHDALPIFGNLVLADTVGFVRNLSHSLVESFKATLEETVEATLLLHVIDSSSPEMLEQIEARSEEHTSELQSRFDLVCRLLLEKKNTSRRQ